MWEIHTFDEGDCDLFNFVEMVDSSYRQKPSRTNVCDLNMQL